MVALVPTRCAAHRGCCDGGALHLPHAVGCGQSLYVEDGRGHRDRLPLDSLISGAAVPEGVGQQAARDLIRGCQTQARSTAGRRYRPAAAPTWRPPWRRYRDWWRAPAGRLGGDRRGQGSRRTMGIAASGWGDARRRRELPDEEARHCSALSRWRTRPGFPSHRPRTGTSSGRGGATTFQQDLAELLDLHRHPGAFMAECYCGSSGWWRPRRGGRGVRRGPRFTGPARWADRHLLDPRGQRHRAVWRADLESDGARRVELDFREYVLAYTNAATSYPRTSATPRTFVPPFSRWDPEQRAPTIRGAWRTSPRVKQPSAEQAKGGCRARRGGRGGTRDGRAGRPRTRTR